MARNLKTEAQLGFFLSYVYFQAYTLCTGITN